MPNIPTIIAVTQLRANVKPNPTPIKSKLQFHLQLH